MKYVMLLTGNNRMVINELFTYADMNFECMSTSNRYDDIVNHLKYVIPDVFVYCLLGETPDDIKRLGSVEQMLSERNVPIVIIGDSAECEQFRRILPQTGAVFFQRSLSASQLECDLVEMLEARTVRTGADGGELFPQTVEPPARRKHILIVDDDSSVLKLLKGYLAQRYDVATAISGKVALRFLENKDTDVVLLDYEMPEENGAVILDRIRERARTQKLPVIFLTGVTEPDRIQELLSLKIQGYLMKPIDMEKVSSTIKGVLG
ncbi:MAG: response regulator [bacterium]|nr:response regulator [bacterium]MCM1376322.1 response regulator [Muribaculum sp.]